MSSTRRNLFSFAALSGFIVLGAGSSPDLAEELAELGEDPDYEEIDWGSAEGNTDAKRGTIPSAGFSMASLDGRKIWLVNPPNRTPCAKAEAAGMIVDCDTEWDYEGDPEIVIWCTEIPHVAAQTVLDHLGLTGFNIRTHQTNSGAGGTGECGELFEITVRWVD
ncbi:MAG: hypothetical protein ACI8RZ_001610 [Myxococcota bacterium]|jgi:hypothetical protein